MLTPEQEEQVIMRDGARCIICGSVDELRVVNIDQSDQREPSNYAVLCPVHHAQIHKQVLRIMGTPGNWIIQELDTLTKQWNVRKPAALATPVEAGQVVHTVGNIIPAMYDSLHQKIGDMSTEHLREVFVELDTSVMSAFKLKCHIAHEFLRRAHVNITRAVAHSRSEEERMRAIADMLQRYSPSYLADLANVWEKVGARWDELIGPVPIPPTLVVELCRFKDTERGLRWCQDYISRFHQHPSPERLRAARAMGFPDIQTLPDPQRLARSCRICAHLGRAPLSWRIVLQDENGSAIASASGNKAMYCKKKLIVFVRHERLDLIAESCPYFEQGVRRRHYQRRASTGHIQPMPSVSKEEEGEEHDQHRSGDDGSHEE